MSKRAVTILAVAFCILASSESPAADFTNYIGMAFVTIPSGSFFMGSCTKSNWTPGACPSGTTLDPDARMDETPQHRVVIRRPFELGIVSVTKGQFNRFLATRPDLATVDFQKINTGSDEYPVVGISWNDANAFVKWLNRMKPLSDRGIYRLPTEAEWEYAARAGSKTRYAFGDDPGQLGTYSWFYNNWGARSHAVGELRPNRFGLYDMPGFIREWVEDCYATKLLGDMGIGTYLGAPADGAARTGAPDCPRVTRGGEPISDPSDFRPAHRTGGEAWARQIFLGFRVARTLP